MKAAPRSKLLVRIHDLEMRGYGKIVMFEVLVTGVLVSSGLIRRADDAESGPLELIFVGSGKGLDSSIEVVDKFDLWLLVSYGETSSTA